MFAIKCDRCLNELDRPGALLITPPDEKGQCYKRHLCLACFQNFAMRWMRPHLDENGF